MCNRGGDAEKRRRIVLEIIRRVRARVSSNFIVGVKLNSSDHQKGGFSEEESMELVRVLDAEQLDFIEISGGCYESAAMMKAPPQRESSAVREAFFMKFATQVCTKSSRLCIDRLIDWCI
jgi:2,4-dienoyl-CoA reductase-like NADH-dependent reductase (Old Yellow Enzyme family)